ncbi:hypothetical protein CVT26_006585 [Gymnopilus dilepis]|uniref:Pectate lyase n=1 Tax=Gymnopilus dilepis TaxID=231916 RepID=A0A409Y320_9AGAR|nr:hypothetical protein CVT26_006585 [Gymnopilus dilepis]
MVKIAVSVIVAALLSAPVLGRPVPSEGLQARNHCVINNNGVKQSIQVAPGQDCSVFNNNGAGGSQSASCSGDDCNIVENGDGSVSVSASSVGRRKRRDLSGRAIVQGLKARSETCTITINGVTKTINLQPGQPCVANANSGFGGDDSGDDANDGAGADDSGDNVNDNESPNLTPPSLFMNSNSIFNGADGDNASCSGDNCSIIDNGDGSVSVSASSFGSVASLDRPCNFRTVLTCSRKRDFSDFFGLVIFNS